MEQIILQTITTFAGIFSGLGCDLNLWRGNLVLTSNRAQHEKKEREEKNQQKLSFYNAEHWQNGLLTELLQETLFAVVAKIYISNVITNV